MAPPHPLKQVASLLCDARDVGGRRAFVDVDVLPARVPIVCLQVGITVYPLSGSHVVRRHSRTKQAARRQQPAAQSKR